MSRPKGNLSNGNIVWAIKQYWLKARRGDSGAEQGEPRPEAARRKAGQAWEGDRQARSMFNYF